MTLLAVSEKRRHGPIDLKNPENKQPVESLELSFREANILFDGQQHPVLVVTVYGTTHITTPGGHWSLHEAGYFQATDDEVNTLRQVGYELPDWRALTIVDLIRAHPDWKLATDG
jgi:hypothetical protein